MYIIYGIKNCSTMKKAFNLLDELGVQYTFHDYKKSAVDPSILRQWIDVLGLETVINRKGTTWRGLSAAEQAEAANVESALVLMQNKTSLIKRPILSNGKEILICGFSEDEYRQLT